MSIFAIDNPTADILHDFYERGVIYNLRDLPQGEHRLYVHPRLVMRHKDAKDAKSHPFYLHYAQSLVASNTTLLDIVSIALFEHPSLIYYTLGKRNYRYNTVLDSALSTGRVFVI